MLNVKQQPHYKAAKYQGVESDVCCNHVAKQHYIRVVNLICLITTIL